MTTPITLESIANACALPAKGTRSYARVQLEGNLELAFVRTSGRRNEPLEAWYLTSGQERLRVDEVQVEALLKLLMGTEVLTTR
jgi:hypothetical protein